MAPSHDAIVRQMSQFSLGSPNQCFMSSWWSRGSYAGTKVGIFAPCDEFGICADTWLVDFYRKHVGTYTIVPWSMWAPRQNLGPLLKAKLLVSYMKKSKTPLNSKELRVYGTTKGIWDYPPQHQSLSPGVSWSRNDIQNSELPSIPLLSSLPQRPHWSDRKI